MKKLLFVFLFAFIVVSCARKDNSVAGNNDIKTIKIDVDGCEKDMDISDMFDTSFFRIIPLETTPESLIGGEVCQVFYRNDRLYVVEKMAKGLFVFDDNGKFLSKIQSYGQGPEEYIEITAVSITADRIIVFDQFSRKVLIYDLDCNYISQFSVNRNLPALDIFAIEDRVYYVSKMEEVRNGHGPYRLSSTNMKGGDLQKHIPFDTATVWPGYTRVNGIFNNISGDVKLMYKRTDTIYSVSNEGARAEYIVDLGDKALPEYFRTNMGEARKPENRKKYVDGFSKMFETKDKLIFHFEYGILPKSDMKEFNEMAAKDPKKAVVWMRTEWPTIMYYAFYDKNTGETTVTNGLSIKWLGRYRTGFQYCDYPYVMFVEEIYEPYSEKQIDAMEMPNAGYRKAFKKAFLGKGEGDNPIVFVYKLKR